jgi:hypothetical protein
MEGNSIAVFDTVEAPLNYLAPTAEKPYVYAYDPPPGMPARHGEVDRRAVTIRDGRRLAPEFSLDREGFAWRRRATAFTDFYDPGAVTRAYYPEVAQLMQEVSGAAEVVVFDHIVRNAARARGGEDKVVGGAKEPAKIVHNDYTEDSAPQRVRDFLGEAAPRRLAGRFAIINLWRPLRGPVLESPIALCDARTIAPEDLVASERRYPHRVGETYQVTWSPRHRWYYFPRMAADEVLFIKCFDSARDGRARISIHGAFDDPTTPPDAPPRQSIEVRTFAFW